MKYVSVETHTHTVHSDAQLTVKELLEACRKAEWDAFVLTDHNTDSGMEEVPANQVSPAVIPGIEWTTFHGHVIVIAPDRFVEFRDLTTQNLDAHIDKVHDAGGVAILAHPCDPGEPFCCGCHCDFEIQRWENVDGMEVWHEEDPDASEWNRRSKALWLKKLDEGFCITALCASDWHVTFPEDVPFGVNYLGLDENLPVANAVKNAIIAGRCFVTMGPTIALSLHQKDATAGIGDTVLPGDATLSLCFDDAQRKNVWQHYSIVPKTVAVIQNHTETVLPFPGYGEKISVPRKLASGYIRVELRGSLLGNPRTLLMTNPVYIR